MSDQALDLQRRMWTVGDYPRIAEHLRPISVETVAAAGVGAGMEVLDVGVGTGNAAIEAVRQGASVTGIDLTPAQVELARARCTAEGVDVELRVGDAQALDVPDASYDVVLSVMGMIFAPDHAAATRELARACRPDGRVAFTAWATGGFGTEWRTRAVAAGLPGPPPGTPSPDDWGDVAEARRRLEAADLTPVTIEVRPFEWRFGSVDDAVATFSGAAGPFVVFLEAADGAGQGDDARSLLRSTMAELNVATDGSCVLPSPYLLAISRPSQASR